MGDERRELPTARLFCWLCDQLDPNKEMMEISEAITAA
ncbi:hypothetical protein LAC1533_0154 [Ligilactobacillus acidipiscis]|uniref:Uncharacterized protein n=1 Tax=Ligilactobacillus acidipiscis TaxID=89059 RepID=A0A1K1KL10_9LACO|nr:hypothetical protein LAC1533_0154 [Ligilactobacillus acidipiscis]